MKVRPSIIFLYSVLITAFPSLGQDQTPQHSHLFQPLTTSSNNDGLKKELLRIQMEMSRIAQDMDAIDAQMMLGIANQTSSGIPEVIPQVHELLKGYNAVGTIKVFSDSPQSDIEWESCLKTGKLYRGLLEKIFEMTKEPLPGGEKTRTSSSIADESPAAVQLAFLARMMTELELQYSELQSQLRVNPDVKQQELWHGLRLALQNDDKTYLKKLTALLAKTGVAPGHFAANVISDARKTNDTAANAVVEGMGIVSPEGDIWRLAEIPGINPDFIRALECDRRARKDFSATGSNTAFLQASTCRKYADGTTILAFALKPTDQAKSADLAGKTPSNAGRLPPDLSTLRLTKEDLTPEPPDLAKGDRKAGAEPRPGESKGENFGATFSSTPQPKIPSWWIRCMCPDDHPDAGMVVNGVRWHAPVLQCPNPELKRWGK